MTLTVEARGLTKRYGALRAVNEVSFAIPGGSIVGLLGRNGAGKTTLMQLITGQELATAGEVRVLGENPVENPRVMSTLCFVKEAQKYPEDFRVRHVMSVAPRFFPNWDAEYAERLIDEFRLTRKQRIKKLSRGQLSSVGIIVGLASRAPVTIFDEPYLGLDAIARQNFYDHLLADYSDNPRTIILSTHLIDEVANLLEHAIVIDDGRIVLDAPVDELRASAVTVSGPASAVDTLLTGREVMHHQTLGGLATATVAALSEAERASAAGEGLEVGPVSLQQLIIRRSGGWTTANVVAWPLGVLAFILLLNIGIGIVIEQATQSAADSGGEADVTITVSGGVAFVYIYMLVIAVQSVNMSFSIALGWGATRRDFALGTLAFFGIMSLSYGLLIAAMAVVERVTGGWGRRLQFFVDAGVLGTALWSLVITALATLTLYLVLRWATPRD
ncbi:ABC transporter ATP-binding protein [Microcella alkaliphila]|uniref:ABC transporter, ATP-binding protein n=1 Tax=Microcella alkaliphila TaxID=279828 RepID=A0A0U5BQC5_9MICO|nr:ABC transporter ATP-binding protein [Microcella alkaliphila]BAU32812.1 ABC transporter, ATP-binding protein [Microcella alkaliphila]